MKIVPFILVFALLLVQQYAIGQSAVDAIKFFKEDKPLDIKISTDMGYLLNSKSKDENQKAIFTLQDPNGVPISEEIILTVRGHMRRSICTVPPVKLNFKSTQASKLSSLGNLKLVNACKGGSFDEQLLLKEYLIYKMYNLITDTSFRVRFANITYEDSKGKKKPVVQVGFFIENIDALAKRSKSRELNDIKIYSESTDRKQMTLVNIFEFMIGNTDWSVPNNHNVKLIKSKKDSFALPIPIPYDFDFAGLVNADYATPDPIMQTESVLTRVYRGFPRKMEELQEAFLVFKEKKEPIYALINQFEPLNNGNKNEMKNYLDGFYKVINNPKEVKYSFIDNARSK